MHIERKQYYHQVLASIEYNPITAILGPRQCGKSTLAAEIAKQFNATFFDLEDPNDYSLLSGTAMNVLTQLSGLVIIDEIQQLPNLFQTLRVIADKKIADQKILILGSASPYIIKNASETLAGRISFVDLHVFNIREVGSANINKLWERGGFPLSYLAKNDTISYQWRENFIRTFLERDLPQLGINVPSITMRRFWTMLAHFHGQQWNSAQVGQSMGITKPTVGKYLDILTGAYMVRQVQPWYENLGKRQVKAARVYIRDTGILHSLLNLKGKQFLAHPTAGASWEGFVIEELISLFTTRDYYYWRTHAGAELDFLIFHSGQRIGFEIKLNDSPKTTKSMHIAIEDLKLDCLHIIYPGQRTIFTTEKIQLVAFEHMHKTLQEKYDLE